MIRCRMVSKLQNNGNAIVEDILYWGIKEYIPMEAVFLNHLLFSQCDSVEDILAHIGKNRK